MTKASVTCGGKLRGRGRGKGSRFALPERGIVGRLSVRCAAYHNLTWRSACSYQLCCAVDVTYPVSVSRVPCAGSPTCFSACCCSFCRLVSSRLVLSRVAWRGMVTL